ncbi:MAG: putative type II secretion system protein D [Planctomycetota bacterium]|nr:MAG: putative type II secretion system protein D [Planctomycetota bacterium]
MLACLLALAPGAAAQDIETFEDTYVLQFDETEGEAMEDFLDLAKHILGKPLKYNLGDMSGDRIQILGPVTVKHDRFENFFQAILKSYGYLVVGYGSDGSGEFLEIVKLQAGGRGNPGGVDVRSQAPTVQLEVIEAFRNNPATLITTSIPLRYIDARSAVSTFQSFFSQTTEAIRAVENSNSLVITGFGTNVWAAWELVQLVDVPPFKPEPTFEKRLLQFRAVDEVEPVLTELLNASQGLRQGQQAGAQQAGAAGLREVEPRIIVDGGANALILIGEADVVARMQTWIDVLDVEVPPSGFTHVIRLQNTDATVMAETLNSVLDDAQAAQQQQQRSQASAAGSSNLEIPASVVADTTSNSLVVTASDRKYAEIVEVLRQLDVRRRQVLVEAAIVETTKSLNDVFTTGISAASSDAAFATTFGAPTGLDDMGALDIGGTINSLSPGGSVAILSGSDLPIPVFLQWLESTSENRVLSRPSLLTNDNEEAELASEEETAYRVTTTGQNSITTESFDTVTAGIRLGISPTISAGNYLRLLVRLEVSDFADSRSGLPGAPPDIRTREIDTPITVPDGHTVILGGLVSKSENESESKIPWLGDLPGLGWLFKATSGGTADRYLYVFITAHIIDTDFALLTEISEARKGDVERLGGDISELVGSLVPEGAESEDLPALAGVEALFDLPVAAMPATGERPVARNTRGSAADSGPGDATPIEIVDDYEPLFGHEGGGR